MAFDCPRIILQGTVSSRVASALTRNLFCLDLICFDFRIWSAPTTAALWIASHFCRSVDPKRRRAALAAALQIRTSLPIFPVRRGLFELIEHLILVLTFLATPGGNVCSAQFIMDQRILRVELGCDLEIVHRLLDGRLLE